jgi:hypothetical protein
VHNAGDEPLEELPLTEDVGPLASDPAGEVVEARDGSPERVEASQEPHPAREQAPREGEGDRQQARSDDHARQSIGTVEGVLARSEGGPTASMLT